jgi:nicotinate-nucleotide--dimethylbenzimidazole phosphoribosyltransferase
MTLNSLLESIRPADGALLEKARARQLELTKPPESLGRLEEIANRIAAIQGSLSPSVDRPRIVLFAADHGVCAEGVNPYPQAVTAQMVANFLRGGAAINAIARVVGAELTIVDAGVAFDISGVAFDIPSLGSLVSRPIARGTRNFCVEPAMSPEQALASISMGAEMADEAVAEGCRLLGIGEMGIGNTTAASALTAALTGLSADSVTGVGTGASEACLLRKRSAIERALALHISQIAAMCGCCLGAAAKRCAVLVDGFIATVAAALAVQFDRRVKDYLFAAHRSTEPGHAPLLEFIGQRPLLDLEMRLGEGTGAALAVPLVRAAVEAFTGMATFASASISERDGPAS